MDSRDVGHRVVVRRFVGVGEHGRPLFSDLLGDLISADPETLVVRTSDGTAHAVARADVTAAKRIPPRPTAYSEIIALERVADRLWPALDREPLGEWILRAAEGWTGRANSALPLGDPGRSLDEAIDAVVAWYSARGLRPAVNVPLPLRRDVDRALADRGWEASPVALVQTADLTTVLERVPDRLELPPVALTDGPSAAFLAVAEGRKNSLPAAARHVLTAVPRVRFAEAYAPSGDLLGMARGAVEPPWVQFALIETAEAARRTGLARHVLRALAAWARGLGAERAFLQVEERNEAAVTLYTGLGFTTHHRYHTRRAPHGAL